MPNSISCGVTEFQQNSDVINSEKFAFWFFISIVDVRNSVKFALFHLIRNCVIKRVYSHFADRALYKMNFPWRSTCKSSFCATRIFTPWTRRIIVWVLQCKFTRYAIIDINFSDYLAEFITTSMMFSYSNFFGGVFAPSVMQTTIFCLLG